MLDLPFMSYRLSVSNWELKFVFTRTSFFSRSILHLTEKQSTLRSIKIASSLGLASKFFLFEAIISCFPLGNAGNSWRFVSFSFFKELTSSSDGMSSLSSNSSGWSKPDCLSDFGQINKQQLHFNEKPISELHGEVDSSKPVLSIYVYCLYSAGRYDFEAGKSITRAIGRGGLWNRNGRSESHPLSCQ